MSVKDERHLIVPSRPFGKRGNVYGWIDPSADEDFLGFVNSHPIHAMQMNTKSTKIDDGEVALLLGTVKKTYSRCERSSENSKYSNANTVDLIKDNKNSKKSVEKERGRNASKAKKKSEQDVKELEDNIRNKLVGILKDIEPNKEDEQTETSLTLRLSKVKELRTYSKKKKTNAVNKPQNAQSANKLNILPVLCPLSSDILNRLREQKNVKLLPALKINTKSVDFLPNNALLENILFNGSYSEIENSEITQEQLKEINRSLNLHTSTSEAINFNIVSTSALSLGNVTCLTVSSDSFAETETVKSGNYCLPNSALLCKPNVMLASETNSVHQNVISTSNVSSDGCSSALQSSVSESQNISHTKPLKEITSKEIPTSIQKPLAQNPALIQTITTNTNQSLLQRTSPLTPLNVSPSTSVSSTLSNQSGNNLQGKKIILVKKNQNITLKPLTALNSSDPKVKILKQMKHRPLILNKVKIVQPSLVPIKNKTTTNNDNSTKSENKTPEKDSLKPVQSGFTESNASSSKDKDEISNDQCSNNSNKINCIPLKKLLLMQSKNDGFNAKLDIKEANQIESDKEMVNEDDPVINCENIEQNVQNVCSDKNDQEDKIISEHINKHNSEEDTVSVKENISNEINQVMQDYKKQPYEEEDLLKCDLSKDAIKEIILGSNEGKKLKEESMEKSDQNNSNSRGNSPGSGNVTNNCVRNVNSDKPQPSRGNPEASSEGHKSIHPETHKMDDTHTKTVAVQANKTSDFLNKNKEDCAVQFPEISEMSPIGQLSPIFDDVSLLEGLDENLDAIDSFFRIGSSISGEHFLKSPERAAKVSLADANRKKHERWKLCFFKDMKKCVDQDLCGNMPIHIAVVKEDIRMIKRQCLALLARFKTIDVKNNNGHTALHLAVLNQVNIDIIDILCKYRSSVTELDDEGNNIFHLAVCNGNEEILWKLLEYNQGRHANVNIPNFEGFTPLIIGVLHNKYQIVERLLDEGFSPNVKDQKSGRTALFHAIENNNVKMVKLLLQHGADTRVENFFGTSPHDAVFELSHIHQNIKSLVLDKKIVQRQRQDKDRKRRKYFDRNLDNKSKKAKVEQEVRTDVYFTE